MTNLTEYSWYYCKMKYGDIEMLQRGADYFLSGDVPLLNNEVESVLAEVPSYDDWQANQKWIKHLEEKIKIYERKDKQATETSIAYNELAEENKELKEILERHKKATAKAQIRNCDLEIINTQLKELLKECKEYFDHMSPDFDSHDFDEIIAKVDQVLGEE